MMLSQMREYIKRTGETVGSARMCLDPTYTGWVLCIEDMSGRVPLDTDRAGMRCFKNIGTLMSTALDLGLEQVVVEIQPAQDFPALCDWAFDLIDA